MGEPVDKKLDVTDFESSRANGTLNPDGENVQPGIRKDGKDFQEIFVAAGPVSRILSAGLLRQDGHSSRPRITARLKRPTRRFDAPSRHVPAHSRKSVLYACSCQNGRDSSLFGLAPCGVCHARRITATAVRSYRTFSPLPGHFWKGGMFSVALAVYQA